MPNTKEIAPGVFHIPINIVNAYIVGQTASSWVLVDTGIAGHVNKIREAVKTRFGKTARPKFIVLTHGHFDHAGCAADLADFWDVPIYAHRLELPYLTGKSDYPPQDPTVGGAMGLLSRFFSTAGRDLGTRVRKLPEKKHLPGMDGWELHFTPGHSAGHISFFRPEDRLLLSGDAVTTVDVDSYIDMATKKQKVCRPPTPFTCDWESARESVERLAELNPRVLAAGHGVPISGFKAAEQLQKLAEDFPIPEHGRYVREAAEADEDGVTYLPPPVPDPLPKIAAGVGAAALAGIAITVAIHKKGVYRDFDSGQSGKKHGKREAA